MIADNEKMDLDIIFALKKLERETVKDLNIILNCSINIFLDNEIPREHAAILLSDLMSLAGKNFEINLKTVNVFSKKKSGKEKGKIRIKKIKSIYEKEKRVESAAICLSFLFFANVLETNFWIPTHRRGEHWDYWCLDKNGKKEVIEVGGSTSKNGAKKDQSRKKKRFNSSSKRKVPTYISSVGFLECDHIVSRYC